MFKFLSIKNYLKITKLNITKLNLYIIWQNLIHFLQNLKMLQF